MLTIHVYLVQRIICADRLTSCILFFMLTINIDHNFDLD